MRGFLVAIFLFVSFTANAATKNILVTGFWSPTNEMLRRLSPNPKLNPRGWVGKNWRGLGYDVYAYFPEFNDDSVGHGDFRVDFASTYNDFIKYTELHKPIAIVSFGRGYGPWEIEAVYPPDHNPMFVNEKIPSTVGVKVAYPIPRSLREKVKYRSTLPMDEIVRAVGGRGDQEAYIDANGGPGDFLCGFIGYLGAWYQNQHADPSDPSHTVMAGFIHVSPNFEHPEEAAYATLEAMIWKLPK